MARLELFTLIQDILCHKWLNKTFQRSDNQKIVLELLREPGGKAKDKRHIQTCKVKVSRLGTPSTSGKQAYASANLGIHTG